MDKIREGLGDIGLFKLSRDPDPLVQEFVDPLRWLPFHIAAATYPTLRHLLTIQRLNHGSLSLVLHDFITYGQGLLVNKLT